MHPSLTRLDHRPWPLPDSPWIGRQTWSNLLFAHWPVDSTLLKPLIPHELNLQEFKGTAWISVVPFMMENVMLRGLPNLPWISFFPELNVRTYVEFGDKPGVWFFSLDAANALAVITARTFLNLPYFRSKMSLQFENNFIDYTSKRKFSEVTFIAKYKPVSEIHATSKGTLEYWLTERYCLYTKSKKGVLKRLEIHHHPWPLQKAEFVIIENNLFTPLGLSIEGPPALVHFSKTLDVATWAPKKLQNIMLSS
jgi:uncharacterized protein YqjF (DUF2071 family)